MKKILAIVLSVSLMFIGNINVNAEITAESFAEVVEGKIEMLEGVDGYEDTLATYKAADLTGYEESEDKVNVYVFYGETCGYCIELLAHLSTIIPEYKDKINVISYEVWNNSSNASYMERVASHLGEEASGVPYMVIGDQSFSGYSSEMDDDIVSKIESEYSSSDRYDVLEKLDDPVEGEENSGASSILIAFLIAIQILSVVIIIVYIRYRFNMFEELAIENKKDIIASLENKEKSVKKEDKTTKKQK